MLWEAWQESILALVACRRFDDATMTIERALNDGQSASALLNLLLHVEDSAPLGSPVGVGNCLSPQGLRLKIRLMGNAQMPADVIELVRAAHANGLRDGFLSAYLAWGLAQHEMFFEALRAAEDALLDRQNLTDRELGLALRMKGLTLNRLDVRSDWETAFREALEVSVGWSRGLILLDLGGLRSRAGDEAGAMLAFTDALELVVAAEHRAMIRNNMGLTCLRMGRFAEAEEYFMQVTGLRSGFKSRALSGQAAARRALGEWARAESLYRQAVQISSDEDDHRQALRGLGYTQRLAGRHMQALETLRGAATVTQGDQNSGTSWVNVDLAATLVSLGSLDAEAVKAHLKQTGQLDWEDGERAMIVRAELARRTGDAPHARRLLEPLGRTSLWMREEAHALPQLFALLPPEQRPEPLPRPPQTLVYLRTLGIPSVQVNGRRVHLGNLELVTLTALIMADGEMTTDELTDVIRDGTLRGARSAAQRVSRVMRQLRLALGWEESVKATRGAYELDAHVHWTSDVQEALKDNYPITAFLSGISLPWATEQEQYLMLRGSYDLITNE